MKKFQGTLICTDLDGTLLRGNNDVSPENREAIEYFNANDPRGEFVICVQGAEKSEEPEVDMDTALSRVQADRDAGLSLKDAAKRASEETGFSKKMLYDAAVKG